MTDSQWKLIKNLLPKARPGGRPRSTNLRMVVNAIFYLNRSGCAWRYLPESFPPWQTVYDYFSKWSNLGIWKKLNSILNTFVRASESKSSLPRVGIIDSQSVKAHYGEKRGWDGYKRLRGRKRQVIVDTLGLIWACDVHQANTADSIGGVETVKKLHGEQKVKLEKILTDGGYRGVFDAYVPTVLKIKTENTKTKNGSNLGKRRWIVERTFAWFNNYRRLSRDYEKKILHSEGMTYLSMIQLMINRLA